MVGSRRTARDARSADRSAAAILVCSANTGRATSGIRLLRSIASTLRACSDSPEAARTTAGSLARIGARSMRPCTGRRFAGWSLRLAVSTSGSTSLASASLTPATVCTALKFGPTFGSLPAIHQPGPEVWPAALSASRCASARVARAPG